MLNIEDHSDKPQNYRDDIWRIDLSPVLPIITWGLWMVALKFLGYNIVLEICFYISAVHMHIFFVLKQGLRKYAGHVVVTHL